MDWSKADWKLFYARIGDWQETYINRLNEQYIEILSGEGLASEKFWKLNRHIQEDKKYLGVKMSLRKPDLALTLANLLNENVISLDNLDGFSKELQENVKQLRTRLAGRE